MKIKKRIIKIKILPMKCLEITNRGQERCRAVIGRETFALVEARD